VERKWKRRRQSSGERRSEKRKKDRRKEGREYLENVSAVLDTRDSEDDGMGRLEDEGAHAIARLARQIDDLHVPYPLYIIR